MAQLTDRALQRKWTGKDEWRSDSGSRGAGRLIAKLAATGVTFYFQYYLNGQRRFLPIGPYDPKGERGLKLIQARDQAQALSVLMRSGVTDLHGYYTDQEIDRQRLRDQAAAEAARVAREAKSSSLRQLLDAYVNHLERSGKQASQDVKRIFHLHVFEAVPDLVDAKAASIPVDDFVALLAKLIEAGKGRTAGKLRSYLRAAYSLAIRAKTDPDAPLSMRTFGIVTNPIASISALSKYNRARSRVLSAEELVAFVKRLDAMPESPKRDALRLCLLLGGQRPTQLLRARLVDLDLGAKTITLFDTKGARAQPRVHVVPLPDQAMTILAELAIRAKELHSEPNINPAFLFTSDGKRPLRLETVSSLVNQTAAKMLQAQELRDGFELRDVRRTCETMLAATGVSTDIRAQIQSHGLGGIQARHYNRHNYMEEKRAELQKWERHIARLVSGAIGEIIPMKRYS